MLSNNLALPALSILQARSTYAQLLLIASVLLNALGIDLFAALSEMGLGSSPEEVIATGDRAVAAWQQVAPLAFGIWAWMERRAPSYRLVWPWSARDAIASGSSALLVALCLLQSASAARAADEPIRVETGPMASIRQPAAGGVAGPRA